MTNRATSRKSTDSWAEPNLFGSDQPDMFGDVNIPKAYVPRQEHVRNSLSSLLEKMEDADVWPWPRSMVRLHREQTFDYLCALIADENERATWQARIAAQITRLDDAK